VIGRTSRFSSRSECGRDNQFITILHYEPFYPFSLKNPEEEENKDSSSTPPPNSLLLLYDDRVSV